MRGNEIGHKELGIIDKIENLGINLWQEATMVYNHFLCPISHYIPDISVYRAVHCIDEMMLVGCDWLSPHVIGSDYRPLAVLLNAEIKLCIQIENH